jgi:AraC family transcriptional regulator
MEPRIVELGALTLVGLPFYGEPSDGQFGKTWERFVEVEQHATRRVNDHVYYGVEFYGPEVSLTRQWMYFAAIQVSDLAETPDILFGKILPAAKYAVFTVKGGLDGINDMFAHAYRVWLPASAYEVAYPFDFELYDRRYHGNVPESEIDLYIPIKPK